jgi:inorganic pyrophosphatase
VYKDLEEMETRVLGWERAQMAKEQILYAADLYQRRFGTSEPEA